MEPILAKKRVRRSWSDEEKRSICLQTLAPGVSVAQVALRYAMNANLIFNWLKDPRFAPDGFEVEEPVFLPVEVEATNMSPSVHVAPSLSLSHSAQHPDGRIEIELVNGHRLTVRGRFDCDALSRLLKGLAS